TILPFRPPHEFTEQQHFSQFVRPVGVFEDFGLLILVSKQHRALKIFAIFKVINELHPSHRDESRPDRRTIRSCKHCRKPFNLILFCLSFTGQPYVTIHRNFFIGFGNELFDNLRPKIARDGWFPSLTLLMLTQRLNNKPSQPAAFRFLLHADRHARRALPAISKGNESASPARQRLSPIAGQLLIALVVLTVLQNRGNSIGYIKRASKHCSPEWERPMEAAVATTFSAT